MDEKMLSKACERFSSEFEQMFNKASAKQDWPKECVETMKDLLKCIYYCEVLEAMHNPEEYSGNSYGYDGGTSSAQRRNSMGQFSRNGSYAMGRGGNSGYPMSGRRYYSYDDERHSAMDRLRNMVNNESNEEVRMALQNAMNELSMR